MKTKPVSTLDQIAANASFAKFRPWRSSHALRLLKRLGVACVLLGALLNLPAAFTTFDTFESIPIGDLNGQNGWTVQNTTGIVTNDPANAADKVMAVTGTTPNVFKGLTLPNGSTGTLFFRFRWNGPKNYSIGLSDVATPTGFGDYEAQLNMNLPENTLNVRSAGSFLPLGNLSADTWYYAWLVVDNAADNVAVYLTTAGRDATEGDRRAFGDTNLFTFRNGVAANNLVTFFIKTGSGTAPQESQTGLLYVDDIYFDAAGANQRNPLAPALVAQSGVAAVNLSWSAAPKAASYDVKRATTAGGPYVTITNTTALALQDTDVVNGTTYYYVVSGVSAATEVFDSAQVSAQPMLAVTDLTAGYANGQIDLSWPAVAGATSYNVYRSIVAGGPYQLLDGTVAGTTFTDNTFTNGATYFYIVTADLPEGEGLPSPERSVLTPPAILVQPQGVSLPDGGTFNLSVTAVGQGTLTYQWRKDGENIGSANNPTYSRSNVTTNDSGAYDVVVGNAAGNVTSSVATVTVLLSPVITQHPQAQYYFEENSFGGFSVQARGLVPLTFLWQKFDGTDWQAVYSEAPTSNSLGRLSWLAADSGQYRVVVTNELGAATSSVANVTVVLPIIITTEPQDAVANAGSQHTFTVESTGNVLSYQWFKDNQALSGQTAQSLTINPVAIASEGNYFVVISNPSFVTTSRVAFLDVKFAPVVTTQPANRTTTIGGSATFTVAVNADPAATYQWRINDIDIPGANSASLPITDANMHLVGRYTVVASNDRGSVTSAVATLQVNYPAAAFFDPFPDLANFIVNYFVNSDNYNIVASGGVGNSSALDFVNANDGSATYQVRSFDFSQAGKVLGVSIMIKPKNTGTEQRLMQIGFVQNSNSRPNADADKQWITLRWNTTTTSQETLIRYQNKSGTDTAVNDGYIQQRTRTHGTLTNWYRMVAWFENIGGGMYKISGGVWEYGVSGTVPGRMILYHPEYVVTNAAICSDSSVWAVFRGNDTQTDLLDDFAVYENYRPLPLISSAPLSQTVSVGGQAVFRVGLEGSLLASPFVQWYANGVAVPGATNINYTTPPMPASANGTLYHVVASSQYGTVTSSVARVTVVGTDSTGPAVVSAGSANPYVVGVAFNEGLDPVTAQNPANYTVSGAVVARAILQPDYKSVRLELSSPLQGTAFSVTVANVADVSGNVGGGMVASTAWAPGWYGTNVGYPLVNGEVELSTAPGQVQFSAGGSDIWGQNDNGFMYLSPRTGDFDVKVRVDEIIRPPETLIIEAQNASDLAKFGLIARDDTYSAAPQITFHPFPPPGNRVWPGLNRFEAGRRNTPAADMGTFFNATTPAVNFPNCWIRLRRSGDTFNVYNSHDGITWTHLGQHIKAGTTPTMWVGLMGTVHFNTTWYMGKAAARFSEYGDFAYPGASINLTTDLAASATVNENGTVVLTVAATATIPATNNPNAEIRYIWQRQLAGGVWENITNLNAATATSYTTPQLRHGQDNGSRYRCIVRVPGAEVISTATVITVNDTTAPTVTLTRVMPGQTNGLVVSFSEPVHATTGSDPNNYVVFDGNNNYWPVQTATVFGNGTNVVLTFANGLTPALLYNVTIDNVTDRAGNPILGGTQVSFTMEDQSTKLVQMEFYSNMPNLGGRVQDVLSHPRILAGFLDGMYYTNSTGFGSPTYGDSGLNNYVSRGRAYFVPDVTGVYRFYIKSDDGGRLLMNTNAVDSWDPTGVKFVAFTGGSSGNTWGTGNRYTLNGVYMAAGKRYYWEYVHAEGSGGDYWRVTYNFNSTTTPADANSEIPANLLAPVAGPIAIRDLLPGMPLNYQGPTTFKVRGITGAGPYIVQWYRDGQPIVGAQGWEVTLNLTVADAGSVITCIVSNLFSKAEVSATVAFEQSVEPLQITSVRSSPLFDGVSVTFNHNPSPASLFAPGAVTVGGGLQLRDIIIRPDGKTVFFKTSFQDEYTTYPMSFNGVTDAGPSPAPVSISTNFTSHFLVQGFVRAERFDELGLPTFANPTQPDQALLVNPKFIHRTPDIAEPRNAFSYTPANLEYYGARLFAWFIPPASGNYAFYSRSDDGSTTYLNPMGMDSEGKVLVGRVTSAGVNYDDKTLGVIRYSVASLVGGQRYFIEGQYQEGTGGDYYHLMVRGPNDYVVPTTSDLGTAGTQFLMPVAPENRTDVYILKELGTVTVNSGQRANLSGMMAATDNRFLTQYVWQRETALGSGVFTNIPYAYGTTYSTPPLYEATNRFRLMAYSPSGFASSIGTAIVAGNLPLTLVRAYTPSNHLPNVFSLTNIMVEFSEGVEPASANVAANYTVTSGGTNVPVLSATLQADGVTVRVTTARLWAGQPYTVMVNNVRDNSPAHEMIAANSEVTYSTPAPYNGFIRKRFSFSTGSLADFYGRAEFINDTPNEITFPTTPDLGSIADNYALRLQGYIIPDTTGNHTFYIATDDQGEFYLSTDHNPANMTLRCYEQGHANGQRNWTGAGSGRTINPVTQDYFNVSPGIFLVAGQPYYFELRMREGTGGDYAGLNWRRPGESVPANGSVSRIVTQHLMGLFADSLASVGPLPSLIVTNESAVLTFAPAMTGVPKRTVQWYRDGLPIEGATLPSFTTAPLAYPANASNTYHVVVSCEHNSVTSAPVVVIVEEDLIAPALASAQGGFRGTREFLLRFSEPVLAANANDAANYMVTNEMGSLTVTAARLLGNNRDVLLTLDPPPAEGAAYTILATNIVDRSSAANVASGYLTAQVTAWVFSTHFGYYERYTNTAGAAIGDLLNSAKYLGLVPDITGYTNVMSIGNNLTGSLWDNYGVVMRGFFTPTNDGLYTIYLAHDDAVVLRASPDDNPANAVELINQGCCQGTFADGARSTNITLLAGQRYFFEVLGKEGGGGDYFRIGIRPFVDVTDPAWTDPATLAPLSGSQLGVYAPPAVINITQQPQSTNQTPYRTVSLAVAAEVAPEEAGQFMSYQWRSNGVDIAGAIGPAYTSGLIPADVASINYTVMVMAPGAAATESEVAVVTVVPDGEAPEIDWVATLNGSQVLVRFSEFVDDQNIYNAADDTLYHIQNNLVNAVVAAQLLADGRTVRLTVDPPLAEDFVLEVDFAYDRFGNMAISLVAPGKHFHLNSADIGTLTLPSVVGLVDDQTISVVADGADIWGTVDAQNLLSRPVTGDFDVSVRVKSLFLANAWTKAGLMARVSTANNSLNFAMLSTPAGGQNTFSFQWRDPAVFPNSQSTGDAAIGLVRPAIGPYPNNWVRLVRQGDVFAAYYSFDGENWLYHYSRTSAVARTMLVGLATTSHDVNIPTTAEYDNLYFPPAPVITQQPDPASVVVNLNGSLTLTAAAENPANSGPLVIKWYKDNAVIPGANSATLELQNLQAADSGVYVFSAGNHGGETWSQPVQVQVVNQRPVSGADVLRTQPGQPVTTTIAELLANDTDPEGGAINFERIWVNLPSIHHWDFNDGAVPLNTMVFGNARVDTAGGIGGGGSLKLTDATANQQGAFVLNDPAISAMAVGEFTISGKLFIGNGNVPPADGMSFNFATDLPDGTAGNAERGVGTGFSVNIDTYGTDMGVEVKVGAWMVRYPFSSALVMSGYQDIYIHMDADGTVDVEIGGVRYFNNFQTPYQPITGGRFGIYARTGGSYQTHWLDDLNIIALPGSTPQGGTLVVANGQVTYTPPQNLCGADTFYYSVNDGQAGGQSVHAVTVVVEETTPEPPVFVTGLENSMVPANDQHVYVLADLRPQVVVTDNGCYFVLEQIPAAGTELPLGIHTVTIIATDGIGLTATNSATVHVFATVTPTITQQPTNVTVAVGEDATFAVAAFGGDPLEYQWKKNGVDIDGATNATLTLTNVTLAAAGIYTVEVRNIVGGTLSQEATLVVTTIEPPAAPNIAAPAFGQGGFTFTVESVNGIWYWIEYKTNLNAAEWQRLPAVQGTGGILTLTDGSPASANRFYRVAASPTQP